MIKHNLGIEKEFMYFEIQKKIEIEFSNLTRGNFWTKLFHLEATYLPCGKDFKPQF